MKITACRVNAWRGESTSQKGADIRITNITHCFDIYNSDFVWQWMPTNCLLKVKVKTQYRTKQLSQNQSIFNKATEALCHVSCCMTTKHVTTLMLVFRYLAMYAVLHTGSTVAFHLDSYMVNVKFPLHQAQGLPQHKVWICWTICTHKTCLQY